MNVRRFATLLAALVVLVATARPATAQATLADERYRVSEVSQGWGGLAGKGYAEKRFLVENLDSEPHLFELRLGAAARDSWTGMGAVASASLEPGERREVDVLLPLFAQDPGDYVALELHVDGSRAPHQLAISTDLGLWNGTTLAVAVYSDRALGFGWTERVASELSVSPLASVSADDVVAFTQPCPRWYQSEGAWRLGRPLSDAMVERRVEHVRRESTYPYAVALYPTALLPRTFAGLSSLDAVVLDGGPLEPGALTELARWVRLGGCVVVARDDGFASFGDLDEARRPERSLVSFGDARVARLGLGTVVFSDREPLSEGQRLGLWYVHERGPSWIAARQAQPAAAQPMRWHMGAPTLPGVGQVSHRTLLGALIVLAAVMGPLNLFFVRRTRVPAALLVTVPLLSVTGSIAVVLYGVVRDGLGAKDAVVAYTVLDQEAQTVSTVALRSLFLGSSGGRRLQPGPGTMVLPLEGESFGDRDRFVVSRAAGASAPSFGGEFLPVRRAFVHAVHTDRSARLRLDVRREDGVVRVENALGAAVEELWLRDRDGALWYAGEPIGATATRALERVEDGEERLDAFLSSIAPGPYACGFERLAPGSYAARLSGLVGFDDCGVAARRLVEEQSLVGHLEQEALR